MFRSSSLPEGHPLLLYKVFEIASTINSSASTTLTKLLRPRLKNSAEVGILQLDPKVLGLARLHLLAVENSLETGRGGAYGRLQQHSAL